MEIPGWFGPTEFYAILVTVNFFIFSWILVNILKVKQGIKVRESIVKVKTWFKQRKEKKEEKILGKPFSLE